MVENAHGALNHAVFIVCAILDVERSRSNPKQKQCSKTCLTYIRIWVWERSFMDLEVLKLKIGSRLEDWFLKLGVFSWVKTVEIGWVRPN